MKRALDLFCGGGGAGWGMMQAGYEVTGIDVNPRNQDNYPGTFIAGDVLDTPKEWLDSFDLVWASPPCQAFSVVVGGGDRSRHPNLIPFTRWLLDRHPRTVIENVPGAPIRRDVILMGGMFGLPVRRERHFELSWFPGMMPPPVPPDGRAITISTRDCWQSGPGVKRAKRWPADRMAAFMGIPFAMTRRQAGEAIPPAYARLIAERAGRPDG